jgi:hypothetical protein
MLLVLDKSPLRKALRALLRERRRSFALGKVRSEDLFERALDCGTMVYAPTSSLLDGWLQPCPDPDRMRDVLSASRAPGCTTLVTVVPSASAYEAELDVLRRDGKPYVIVEAAPSVEDFAREIGRGDSDRLWIPREGSVAVTHVRDVAQAVIDASETELQGRVHPVATHTRDVAALFREAADVAGRGSKVRGVWPPLHRVVRPVVRWFRGTEPAALALADMLAERSNPNLWRNQNVGGM